MFVVESYGLAVFMCVITMLCWGSWANTQKLATREWRFQLFYWDYSLGVLLLAVMMAFTLGSRGTAGRGFLEDLGQATGSSLAYAFIGGVVFNFANLLLVAAIDIAGMAVAFPIGIGLALVLGVVVNYVATPDGNPALLFLGVACIVAAILLNAVAYKRLPAQGQKTTAKGIVVSILAGIPMGLFYYLVAASMAKTDHGALESGMLSPYTAVVVFSLGLSLSSFLWNSIVMMKPFVGDPVPFGDYFTKGTIRLHTVGLLGGIIWSIGMSLNILAAVKAGFPVSYGLGQGATMVAAFWGVFIWKEFKAAPAGTMRFIATMFACYFLGLVLIISAKLV
ncbi:MAG: GRP family sugar transporter [Pirellulaceae bacterium]